MTKLFLAASVAVLAISAPAAAKPGDREDRQNAASARESGQRVERSAQRTQRVDRSEQRAQRVDRSEQRAQRVDRSEQRAQRVDRGAQRAERRIERPLMAERQQMRAERQQVRAERPQVRSERVARAENRLAERRDVRSNRVERRETRANRIERDQPRLNERQQMHADRRVDVGDRIATRGDLRDQRIDQRLDRRNDRNGFEPRFTNSNGLALLPPGQARKLIGVPLATAAGYAGYSTFNSFPGSVSYLYPDTDDYYYRYGDGYAYRVDRGSNLISALIPLLFGGYYPGQHLPNNYMNNYMPASYGFNSFYQDTQYDCNRYVNGVVYQVDCYTGMIEGVVPLYAGGYGVGQMLPSAYYNVPYGYRDLYSDSSDYGYHYAPGAIYQYDRQSSLITSVAALLSPGFGIGQQMPSGYGAYNVPYGYRDTYFDSADNWYRYNNGNIYQVDPTTQLVTAIVASILT